MVLLIEEVGEVGEDVLLVFGASNTRLGGRVTSSKRGDQIKLNHVGLIGIWPMGLGFGLGRKLSEDLGEYRSKFHTAYCFLMVSSKDTIDEMAPRNSPASAIIGKVIIESESQGNYR